MSINSPFFGWLTAFATICACLGVLWKWVIGPHVHRFIEENIVKPITKIEHYTTVNGDKDAKNPTMRDDLGSVKAHLIKQDDDMADLKTLIDDHLTVSDGDRLQLARNTAAIAHSTKSQDERIAALEAKFTQP